MLCYILYQIGIYIFQTVEIGKRRSVTKNRSSKIFCVKWESFPKKDHSKNFPSPKLGAKSPPMMQTNSSCHKINIENISPLRHTHRHRQTQQTESDTYRHRQTRTHTYKDRHKQTQTCAHKKTWSAHLMFPPKMCLHIFHTRHSKFR